MEADPFAHPDAQRRFRVLTNIEELERALDYPWDKWDAEIIPSQQRIANVGDEADLEEIYDSERHLLYVACTRARDRLLVTGVDPASGFLDDLKMSLPRGSGPSP